MPPARSRLATRNKEGLSARPRSPGERCVQLTGPVPVLRIARPTDDLEALLRFYRDGLGLEVLDRFEDHDGFDGVILGLPGAPYHLEFTHRTGQRVGRAPSPEHLLVLHLPEPARWQLAVERLLRAGLEPVQAENPYWDVSGWTFEDPDGYRVVLQRAAWPGGS